MNTQAAVGLILAILFVLVGGTLWYQFREVAEPIPEERIDEHQFVPQIINAKHQFKNGVHTVVGEVDLPTPCYLLESDAVVEVREPNTDKATIRFITKGENEICAQVITAGRFKEVFNAQEDADIVATWNSAPVLLNIIDVGPEEDLDLFELFIKG